jgi:hypothetical protein
MEIEIGSAEDLSLDKQVSDLFSLGNDAKSKPCHSLNDVCEGFTKKFRRRSQAAIEREKGRVRERIIELNTSHQEEIQTFLPMEVLALQQARARHRRQETRLFDALAVLEKEHQFSELNAIYDRLDMGFLAETTWSKTHNCKLPVFAVFDLQNPTCTLTVSSEYRLRPREYAYHNEEKRYHYQSVDPDSIREYFDLDGLEALAHRALNSAVRAHPQPQPDLDTLWSKAYGHDDLNASASVTARADFAGVIPDEVRSIIRQALPKFDQLLLVAETESWSVGVQTYVKPQPAMIPVGVDPLVVGRRDRSFWLVTAFDTTPSEEFVRREYRI